MSDIHFPAFSKTMTNFFSRCPVAIADANVNQNHRLEKSHHVNCTLEVFE